MSPIAWVTMTSKEHERIAHATERWGFVVLQTTGVSLSPGRPLGRVWHPGGQHPRPARQP